MYLYHIVCLLGLLFEALFILFDIHIHPELDLLDQPFTKKESYLINEMKPGQAYLLLYNFCQVIGWSYILVKAVLSLIQGASSQQLYAQVALPLQIFQTAAILEILHSVLGLVRSPVGTTAAQITSRILVTWPILYAVQQSHVSVGVYCLVFAWSITEVIRYSFYGLSLLGAVPYLLVWLRYTLFIGLYPLGVTGELLCIWAALPHIKRERLFSYDMPNRWNMSFDAASMLVVFMLMYLPVFPQLYFYMFAQRRKVIGLDQQKKQS